jgi:hypothetical protein
MHLIGARCVLASTSRGSTVFCLPAEIRKLPARFKEFRHFTRLTGVTIVMVSICAENALLQTRVVLSPTDKIYGYINVSVCKIMTMI